MTTPLEVCPGCGLESAPVATPSHEYINASAGCWSVYGEVLVSPFAPSVTAGAVRTLNVDVYAAQHPGGVHPDKSVAIHLVGLYLALERGAPHPTIIRSHQHLASTVRDWPHFEPPADRGGVHVDTVAQARSVEEFVATSHEWASSVWAAWSAHHAAIEAFAEGSGATRLAVGARHAS